MDNLQIDLVTPSRRFVREGETDLRHKITGKGGPSTLVFV